MNVSRVWGITLMIADMCEVIEFLREDPHYTREEAADKLQSIVEMQMDHMYQSAMCERDEK